MNTSQKSSKSLKFDDFDLINSSVQIQISENDASPDNLFNLAYEIYNAMLDNNIDAENMFLGKIENIKSMGSKVRVFCNIGFDIVSDISEYSFKKMNLNINDEIYVIFKSENVKISYT